MPSCCGLLLTCVMWRNVAKAYKSMHAILIKPLHIKRKYFIFWVNVARHVALLLHIHLSCCPGVLDLVVLMLVPFELLVTMALPCA